MIILCVGTYYRKSEQKKKKILYKYVFFSFNCKPSFSLNKKLIQIYSNTVSDT